MLKISVIIPTFNRCNILLQCLKALESQSLSLGNFEVIVVNDGSSDHTLKNLKIYRETTPLNLQIISQKNSGQGVARNKAIKKVNSPITLFIGDDIIINKDFLKEHLKSHKKHPGDNYGVLGFIDWHPEINISPLMNWLCTGGAIFGKFGGHQFAFDKLKGKKYADYNYFYTSNISLKTKLIKKDSFDESFHKYGWEDIELGYRLQKKYNFKLIYNKKAIGLHHHEISLDSFKNRMEHIGESIKIIDLKHPELEKTPSYLKRFVFHILSLEITISFFHFFRKKIKMSESLYYYCLSKKHFLIGLKK
jgi:glycosyltransferase involved in cell wall biosynthesis